MPDLNRQALVPHKASHMYDIVNSVDLYAQFLPWCNASKIIKSTAETMTASVNMKKGPLDQSFTTSNKMIVNEQISIELVNGPFKTLTGQWRFHDVSELGSKISLQLSYEFSNPIISMAVGPVFNQIANTLVDSFCKRADELYG